MKTLIIGTHAQAKKLQMESLFKPVNGHSLSAKLFDKAKYKPEANFIGREVQVGDHVNALWMVRRKDSDGPYQALYCMTDEG